MSVVSRKAIWLVPVCLALATRAGADPIDVTFDDDPATLHIGTGQGTPCAHGCGGDPNVITPTVLSIYQNSGGAPDLLDPLLLILGIPNVTGLASAPAISSVIEYDPDPMLIGPVGSSLGGPAAYGWSGAGFVGNWLPSSLQVYQFIGFEPPNTNASNNATNWFGEVPSAAFFGIYVYRINGTLGDNGLFNVTWAGSGLPDGTIAIAYGCANSVDPITGHCSPTPGQKSSGNVYTTPFTEAGRVTASEPSSLALFGSGLGALVATAFVRRRKR